MAKIRLSAIASDMKGKANGSVFATNRGGLYMRNNPKASVKQTPKFGNAKRSLGFVSQQYKNLTAEEMQAWDDMVSSYPTTNAFGETRIPSGYELFMRLNGVLNAHGFPLISVPALPRPQLSLGDVEITYPDLYQFNPINAFDMRSRRAPLADISALLDNDFLKQKPWDGVTTSFKFMPTPDFQIGDVINLPFNAFCGPCDPMDNGFEYDYVGAESWEFHYTNNDPAGPGFMGGSGEGPAPKPNEPFTVTTTYSAGATPVIRIYVDGVLVITTSSTGVINADTEFSSIFRFGSKGDSGVTKAIFSDLRAYTYVLNPAEMALVAKGYVLGTESTGYGLTKIVDNKFPISFASIEGAALEVSSSIDIPISVTPVSWGFIPDFTLEMTGELLEDSFIEIFATPPKSNGANGNTTRMKSLGLFTPSEEGTIDLAPAYKEVYGNVPANTKVDFFLTLVDSTTGWKSNLTQKIAKRPIRFKTGAVLTDKID